MRAFCIFAFVVTGCAAATGYDASRYTNEANADKPDADVDTAPLPPQPKAKAPDPRRPFITKSDASAP